MTTNVVYRDGSGNQCGSDRGVVDQCGRGGGSSDQCSRDCGDQCGRVW